MRVSQLLIAATATAAWLVYALVAGAASQEPPVGAGPRAVLKEMQKRETRLDVFKVEVSAKVPRVAAVPLNNADARLNHALKPYYYSRLIHARNFLHLSQDQLRRIRPETDKAFKDFLAAVVREQQRLRDEFLDQGLAKQSSGRATDAFAEFAVEIARIVKKHVDPALWPKYDAELAERNVANKEASLQLLILGLDQDLLLSPEQRDKLSLALEGQWNNTWNASLQFPFMGSDYRPNVSDSIVLPILDSEQRRIWQSKRKNQVRSYPTLTVPLMDEARIDRQLGGDGTALDSGVKPEPRKAEPAKPRTGATSHVARERSHVS